MSSYEVLVKTYKGSQDEATKLFQEDARALAARGYFPTSQTYVPGSYGCGAFLLALILCIALIGILILIYMLLVKPDGVLSVSYEFRGTAAARALDEKLCPKCAEQVKVAAQVCRFCGHKFDPATFVVREAAIQAVTEEEAAKAKAMREQTLAYRLGKWIGRQRGKSGSSE